MSRAWVVALLLVASGCHRTLDDPFAHAKARYQQLLDEGARPTDPRFDSVVEELKQVPASSPNHGQAVKMIAAVERARAPRPPAPLAVPNAAEPNENPAITAQRQACEALAKQLGNADGGARAKLEAAIDDCRKKVEQLEEAHESKE
jgi:hypothetical protein